MVLHALEEGCDRFGSVILSSIYGRERVGLVVELDPNETGSDPRALAELADIVDEAVIQTYQGRRTIPGYEAYLRSLSRLPMPYRIALVEGGEWREPEGLASDPQFRGYVVFLLGRR